MKDKKISKKHNNFKHKNINKDIKKEVKIAYYCKKCGVWHYPGSAIYYAHKRYAHQGIRPRRRVPRRRRRTFWDRF